LPWDWPEFAIKPLAFRPLHYREQILQVARGAGRSAAIQHHGGRGWLSGLSGVTTAFVPLGGLPLADDRLLGVAR